MLMLIIVGQAGGNYSTNKGDDSSYLCQMILIMNGKPYPYPNDVLYGGEYSVGGSSKPSGFGDNLHNKDVPCAVCRRRGKSSVLMIPGIRHFNTDYVIKTMVLLSITCKTGVNSSQESKDRERNGQKKKDIKSNDRRQ